MEGYQLRVLNEKCRSVLLRKLQRREEGNDVTQPSTTSFDVENEVLNGFEAVSQLSSMIQIVLDRLEKSGSPFFY